MSQESLPESVLLYSSFEDVLLPRMQLSLVLREKDEIRLFEEAFQQGRYMGVVQSRMDGEGIFETGCLGRITSFSESSSGKVFVVVTGVSRFDVLDVQDNRVTVSYERYMCDTSEKDDVVINRKYLSSLMQDYLNEHEIAADWDEIESASDQYLLHSLTMACPFDPAEKQAILECSDLQKQSLMITSFIEMANPRYKGKKAHYH